MSQSDLVAESSLTLACDVADIKIHAQLGIVSDKFVWLMKEYKTILLKQLRCFLDCFANKEICKTILNRNGEFLWVKRKI